MNIPTVGGYRNRNGGDELDSDELESSPPPLRSDDSGDSEDVDDVGKLDED